MPRPTKFQTERILIEISSPSGYEVAHTSFGIPGHIWRVRFVRGRTARLDVRAVAEQRRCVDAVAVDDESKLDVAVRVYGDERIGARVPDPLSNFTTRGRTCAQPFF